MEANELMIGDYVRFKSDLEVTRIDAYGLCNWIFSNIDPIPLTPEFLEKNGWVCSDGWFERNGVNFFIAKCGDKYKLCQVLHIRSFATITYIHELQHALRLCGLDELADNFKV